MAGGIHLFSTSFDFPIAIESIFHLPEKRQICKSRGHPQRDEFPDLGVQTSPGHCNHMYLVPTAAAAHPTSTCDDLAASTWLNQATPGTGQVGNGERKGCGALHERGQTTTSRCPRPNPASIPHRQPEDGPLTTQRPWPFRLDIVPRSSRFFWSVSERG